ncbi:MAG: hypothetical protein PWP27_2261, partial [Clostridiales bacterium]|nr:hypothetical protein [Clostridiales bacterium]MDK2934451.1 hypothetical protein [Clostridiales bacterium]
MSKKLIAVVLVVMMMATLFSGCLSAKQAPAGNDSTQKSEPAQETKKDQPKKEEPKKNAKIIK